LHLAQNQEEEEEDEAGMGRSEALESEILGWKGSARRTSADRAGGFRRKVPSRSRSALTLKAPLHNFVASGYSDPCVMASPCASVTTVAPEDEIVGISVGEHELKGVREPQALLELRFAHELQRLAGVRS
jgi:hypothetical protein